MAIPACITDIGNDRLATVDILGAEREIALDLTPNAQVGDYVLVHAGFAIEVVDEQFAQETIDLIREFPDLAAEDVDIASGGAGGGVSDGTAAVASGGAAPGMMGGAAAVASGGVAPGISDEKPVAAGEADAFTRGGATHGAGMTMQGALAELAKEL